VSKEALALDISRVVSRVVSGEAVDTAERGAALAAKYPEVGLSGQSISEAIARAAGMVGMIKSAPLPAKSEFVSRQRAEAKAEPASAPPPVTEPSAAGEPPVEPAQQPPPPSVTATPAIDDLLAAAIDAELGDLVAGRKWEGAAPAQEPTQNINPAAPRAGTTDAPPASKSPLSALRRAIFRR
jgi:hypothetical protein